MIKGRIHSIETLGLLDGPGVRTVFFMQGCPLKCKYCHNPDALNFDGGKVYTVDELVTFAKRYKPYYKNNGGVTFSGGEALMQSEFVYEAMKALKKENIHIALDTSGVGQSSYFDQLLELTDLVILDIKHFDSENYRDITGISMKRTEAFMNALDGYNGEIWLRHVMVPGYTDNYTSMDDFFKFISYLHKKIAKIEILPYHKLGVDKYYQLDLSYPLEGVPEMEPSEAKIYEDYMMRKLDRYSIAV
jgi:pyruvate formate lyase activating enzyme